MSVGRKPVVPKRRCARADGARCVSTRGGVVEEHAAAAVHLRVDEARAAASRRRGRGAGADRTRGVGASATTARCARLRRSPPARRRSPRRASTRALTRRASGTPSVGLGDLGRCGGSSGSWPRAIATRVGEAVEALREQQRLPARARRRCVGSIEAPGSAERRRQATCTPRASSSRGERLECRRAPRRPARSTSAGKDARPAAPAGRGAPRRR